MRSALVSLLLLSVSAPGLARECAHTAPRDLDLDLTGVKAVMFVVAQNNLRIEATPGGTGKVSGQACASSEAGLDRLQLIPQRSGDTLVVMTRRPGGKQISFGINYAYMTLEASVPDNLLVQVDVGSGDVSVTGASAFSADVGSGDVAARRIRGRVTAKVGSGDIVLDDIGGLRVLAIGSGEVKATQVRGDAQVGSIGSGELVLRDVTGGVRIESIGSGEVELERIAGAVDIGSVGSGDIDVRGAASLRVGSAGSASIVHHDITGAVELPRRR
jgi:hypothetical protein